MGPPNETTWLRLRHRLSPSTGEHLLRAYTSRDGRTWTAGGAWTLLADSRIPVGLSSMGRGGTTAEFDCVRVRRP
ncbi:hypothetical protein [Streptomyces sp. NPDC058766]